MRPYLLFVFVAIFALAGCEQSPYRDGEALYKAQCANCHMDDGRGLGALMPPLAGADYLKKERAQLPCILMFGLADTIVVNGQTYGEKMPGVPTLTAVEITNILNYVNNAWGNQNGVFTLEEVRKSLETCK
ncbi:MAG: cytochrome c [Saprospiraceae bacterium]|nr:cytochrome c [Saprospiraceae bacterium]MCC6412695.1 cytochrome c [Saprospiraceae bacterium]